MASPTRWRIVTWDDVAISWQMSVCDCATNAIAVGILSGSKLKALDNKVSILRPSLTGNLPHLSTIPLSEQRALAIGPKEIAALYFYMRTHTHIYIYIRISCVCIYIYNNLILYKILMMLHDCHYRDLNNSFRVRPLGTFVELSLASARRRSGYSNWFQSVTQNLCKCHLVQVLQRVSASQIPSTWTVASRLLVSHVLRGRDLAMYCLH